jgi:hypothetical protein
MQEFAGVLPGRLSIQWNAAGQIETACGAAMLRVKDYGKLTLHA